MMAASELCSDEEEDSENCPSDEDSSCKQERSTTELRSGEDEETDSLDTTSESNFRPLDERDRELVQNIISGVREFKNFGVESCLEDIQEKIKEYFNKEEEPNVIYVQEPNNWPVIWASITCFNVIGYYVLKKLFS